MGKYLPKRKAKYLVLRDRRKQMKNILLLHLKSCKEKNNRENVYKYFHENSNSESFSITSCNKIFSSFLLSYLNKKKTIRLKLSVRMLIEIAKKKLNFLLCQQLRSYEACEYKLNKIFSIVTPQTRSISLGFLFHRFQRYLQTT